MEQQSEEMLLEKYEEIAEILDEMLWGGVQI